MADTQNSEAYRFHLDYLQELGDGNAATASHFVSYFGPRLRSLLRKNGTPADAIEELQQETFVRVLAAVGPGKSIRHPERFGSFVKAVCKNALLERYRKSKAYTTLDDSAGQIPDGSMDPVAFISSNEEKRIVRDTLERLLPRDRKLLCAVFMEEKNRDEVCRELGVSRTYMRLLLHRAKRQFILHLQRSKLQLSKRVTSRATSAHMT